ncbi:MAG: hypothetical protein H6748_03845 [Spirochaetaceae bacterium]|nr:hypothetical protein [Myxococcales bacterium]MCB9723164.1 hypothetical protein [Spirochaetaceae bacterium]HPG28219.1 hypothetical protein [Myxococcota bacterium]
MQRFTRGLVMAVCLAGFLGIASPSLAADKVECTMTKDGKQTTQSVESRAKCTKLGGTVVEKVHTHPAHKATDRFNK